jgi:hypothetical protein
MFKVNEINTENKKFKAECERIGEKEIEKERDEMKYIT